MSNKAEAAALMQHKQRLLSQLMFANEQGYHSLLLGALM